MINRNFNSISGAVHSTAPSPFHQSSGKSGRPQDKPDGAKTNFRGVELEVVATEWLNVKYDATDGQVGEGERAMAMFNCARELAPLCDNNVEVMKYALRNCCKDFPDSEWESSITGALKDGKYQYHSVSPTFKDILEKHGVCMEKKKNVATTPSATAVATPSATDSNQAADASDENETQVLVSGNSIGIPKTLSPEFRAIIDPIPEPHKKGGLCVALGMLQVYCSGIQVLGCDNRPKPIALNTVLVGPPSCGKTSVYSFVSDLILKRQMERDQIVQDAHDKWLEAKSMNNGTNTLGKEPKLGLTLFSNVSRNGICMCLKHSGSKNSIILSDELKTIIKQQTNQYNDTPGLLCQGFDHQVTRNNSAMMSSAHGAVTVSLGSVLCSQPEFVERFFGVSDGLATRVLFEIMGQYISLESPKYGAYSQAQVDMINAAVDKLESYNGVVDLPQCRAMLSAWMQSYALEYKEAADAGKPIPFTMTLLSRRASDIALRCAAIAYVIGDCKESAAVKDLCKYVCNSVVQNTYYLLGEEFDKNDAKGRKIMENRQNFKKLSVDQRILSALPSDSEFTATEVEAAMKSVGNNPSANAVAVKISQLKKAGYIVSKGKGKFKKSHVSS